MPDNAFLQIDDLEIANQLAAQFNIEQLHAKLDSFARRYCPPIDEMNMRYNWSIMQAEYATDLVFKQQHILQAFFPPLLETLIQAVKLVDIATFLGRKLHGNYQGELGNHFNLRWLGRRFRPQMGAVAIRRTTSSTSSCGLQPQSISSLFSSKYRQVNHCDGSTSMCWAAMKKTIDSLSLLQETALVGNHRYLKSVSQIETPEVGVEKLHRLIETKEINHHRHKDFNFFAKEDASFFRTLRWGEFFILGFTNKDLGQLLAEKHSGQFPRLLKRLRVHGLIKKVGRTYKYYLSEYSRRVVVMALKLREMVVIPGLAYAYTTQS